MRWKIILVNGGIVSVLAFLTFFLLRTAVGNVVANPAEQRKHVERALRSARAQLQLEALEAERWLGRQVHDASVLEVFQKGTEQARHDAATLEASRLRDLAVSNPAFSGMAPSLVLVVDADGTGLGRNGSELMRGDKVGAAYPALVRAMKERRTGSELWVSEERHERLLVSYAPIADGSAVVGAVVLGVPINDERLERIGASTAGAALALALGDRVLAVGGLRGARGDLRGVFAGAEAKKAALMAAGGAVSFLPGQTSGHYVGALSLDGLSAKKTALFAAAPSALVQSVDGLLWPIFAIAGLGLLLVLVGGVVLGNYISRPISEIEEGLLLVMNGQNDLRFDLEHDELGGLTSRINGLLNSVFEVPEAAPEGSGTSTPTES